MNLLPTKGIIPKNTDAHKRELALWPENMPSSTGAKIIKFEHKEETNNDTSK